MEWLVISAIFVSSLFTNMENQDLRQKNEDLRFENYKLQMQVPSDNKEFPSKQA